MGYTKKEIALKKDLAWNILTELAATNLSITYGSLAEAVGLGKNYARSTRFFLHHIQEFCLQARLPPLTVVVVSSLGHQGSGYTGEAMLTPEEERDLVIKFDWSQVPNPFGDGAGENWIEATTDALLAKPGDLPVLAGVTHRGVRQQIFREALIKAYGGQCAVCAVRMREALDAAHIKPWSVASEAERIDVRNGLLLCKIHHVSFDHGYWWINDDGSVSNKEAMMLGKVVTITTDGLHRPRNSTWAPKAELLAWHREEVAKQRDV
jgi:putative restriction endonuclease